MTGTHHLALFQRKEIRRTLHEGQWWFVLTDVVAALTDSVNPSDYLKKLRKRDPGLGEAMKGGGQNVPPLSLHFPTAGGPQTLLCRHTEGLFRLIQSIPSPKAEPFKRWLARVGYERVQEIEDPELASRRTRAIYKAKGYSDDWIEKRLRSIAIRDELTDEWQKRGVREQREYAILTAEISKAAFGLTPNEYARLKGLKRENLRGHMNDLELVWNGKTRDVCTAILPFQTLEHIDEGHRHLRQLHDDAAARERGMRTVLMAPLRVSSWIGPTFMPTPWHSGASIVGKAPCSPS